MKSRLGQTILRLSVLAALGATAACTSSPQRPNVLLIVVDTLRRDHVGCYGAARETTPALDAFAAQAVRFDRAYSPAPWTMPAVASIFTGLHPSGHGVTRVGGLTDEALTLAEILAQQDYATAGIVSHLLLGARFNFDQGFREFVESYSSMPHHDISTRRVTRQAKEMLERLAGQRRPFFLFVHYFDPHYHYKRHSQYGFAPPTAGRLDGDETIQDLRGMMEDMTDEEVAFIKDLYDEEIRHTDDGIGRLLAALREQNVEENTLVLITSDHGEEFLDRGWLGHTRTLYDELVLAPLVVRPPGGQHPVDAVDTPVSLTALAPTILELVGIDPAAYGFQVESFARLFDGEPPESSAGPFAEVDFVPFSSGKWVREVHKKSLVSDRYKVVRDDTTGLVEIYDLVDDPAESRNLAPERPELASRLLALLEQRIADARSAGLGLDELELELEQVEKLRSLGYVGQ